MCSGEKSFLTFCLHHVGYFACCVYGLDTVVRGFIYIDTLAIVEGRMIPYHMCIKSCMSLDVL